MTDPVRRLFLDVDKSALGRSWRPRLDPAGEGRALAIVQRHGVSDILARVLAGRGVAIDDATAYLDPTLRALMPDPSTLQGLDEAVDRLARAIAGRRDGRDIRRLRRRRRLFCGAARGLSGRLRLPGSRQTATSASPGAAKPRVMELTENVVATSVSPTLAGRDITW